MSRKLLWALLLMAVSVIVLLLSKGSTSVSLGFVTLQGAKSVIYFCFLGIGVVIGVLLK